MCYQKWDGKELFILNNALNIPLPVMQLCVKLYSHMIEHQSAN